MFLFAPACGPTSKLKADAEMGDTPIWPIKGHCTVQHISFVEEVSKSSPHPLPNRKHKIMQEKPIR